MSPRPFIHFTRSLAVLIPLAACGLAEDALPAKVDNSTQKYFPPLLEQKIGDCTCHAAAYYYNTYTNAKANDWDVHRGDDPSKLCSPRFLFALISQGGPGAECSRFVMEKLSIVGCAPPTLHPYDESYENWPTEEAWVAALKARPGPLRTVRADTEDGLKQIKRRLANGDLCVTRAQMRENYFAYPAEIPGTDNNVIYAWGVAGTRVMRHTLCIVGYDDTIAYYDDRRQEERHGAFLFVDSMHVGKLGFNSTGAGERGFFWIAYEMFREGAFGRYDLDDGDWNNWPPQWDACHDNADHPEVYFHDPRPNPKPLLYAVVGVNCGDRNEISLSGGIGPVDKPLFQGPDVLNRTQRGTLSIDDSRRVALDLSDGVKSIPEGGAVDVFVKLHNHWTHRATITSMDVFQDFDGDGQFDKVAAALRRPIVVPCRETGVVRVSISRPTERAKPKEQPAALKH